jgi:gamma-glutamylputrescine oxidase
MINQNWWFTTLLVKPHKYCPPLNKDVKCDVLIVVGGFSGISAAAEFLGKGLSVLMLEKNIVGGSSAGRSAGFLWQQAGCVHGNDKSHWLQAEREILGQQETV